MPLNAQQQAAQRNLSYLLAEKLGQQILAGDYQAGSILPGEMELGEQFGVSRTAVREAVKMLAAKGMLLPRPRIGTRVMPQSQWNFLDQDLLTVDDAGKLRSGDATLPYPAHLSGAAGLRVGGKPRQPAANQAAGGADGGNARAAYPV